jgi:hypothetical protein
MENMGRKRMTYGFQEQLDFSQGAKCDSDAETIMSLLYGCASVTPNTGTGNDCGIDYIATLRRGAEVMIDAKTRAAGCSKYWRGEPELAIEIWSVMPGGKFQINSGKAGWTLDESKKTDMVLYTFSPCDTTVAYLIPFHSLRMAAVRNVVNWRQKYKVDTQETNEGRRGWQSQAVFVPASIVIKAMEETYSGKINVF